MSLRDLGIYAPLTATHPLVADGEKCHFCKTPFIPGMRTGIIPWQTADETGSLTVEGRVVCATCKLRGTEINTPVGRRIVERVKEGDGSPFPVVTTDGRQWRDEEVEP